MPIVQPYRWCVPKSSAALATHGAQARALRTSRLAAPRPHRPAALPKAQRSRLGSRPGGAPPLRSSCWHWTWTAPCWTGALCRQALGVECVPAAHVGACVAATSQSCPCQPSHPPARTPCSSSRVLPSSVEAIRAALSKGITVMLATGKARPAAERAMSAVGLAGRGGIVGRHHPGVFLQGLAAYGPGGRLVAGGELPTSVVQAAFEYSGECSARFLNSGARVPSPQRSPAANTSQPRECL